MSQQEEDGDVSEVTITPADPLILIPSVSKTNIATKPHWISRFSGIFYTLTASLLITASLFTVKQLGVDILDAILLRFLVQVIITTIFALRKHYTLLGGTAQQISLQIICATTGAIGFVLFSLALRYVELSDVSTLAYTRVVWTVVLSVIVYRERPAIGTLLALPLTLLGVVFVTQPSFLFTSNNVSTKSVDHKYRLFGFAMALGCALTSAINVLLFKQLISTSRDIKPSVLNIHYTSAMLFCLILNQFYKIFYLQLATTFTDFLTWRYGLSAFVCLIAIVASIMIQKAIKREHPAVFSLLGSAEIIYALILQNIFTSTRSNTYALFGSGLVISSVVVLGISRIIGERKLQKKMKEKEIKNGETKMEKC